MTTHTELAATHTSFAVSLGDTLREGLWGFRQRFGASTGEYTANAGFHAPLDTNKTSRQTRTETATATAATNPTTIANNPVAGTKGRPMSEEKAATMQGDMAGETAQSTPNAALTSADQDRLSVRAALAGDHSAFADLMTRYQSAVYNMAYRMLGDPTEAEDAAQEVFVRAWNQLRTFQQDKRFSTWLLSIASHHSIDLLRRRKPSAPLDDVALYVPSEDPAPDDLALQGEQRVMVQRLLQSLPEKYRTVTVLRYYNDLSYDEIAHATGLTESAVKTQLHRARRMLAEKLEGAGLAGDDNDTIRHESSRTGNNQERRC
ncbi:MAG: sigma-70 family RNA polymerase sigma factor [Chloroflexota bacterium]